MKAERSSGAWTWLPLGLVLALVGPGCGGSLPVRQQAYAPQKTEKTFEAEFPQVWGGIEKALEKQRVVKRDPDEVTPTELKKLTVRTAETDWVYGQSRDKYVEFQIEGMPKRKPLGLRYKVQVEARKVLGGVLVRVGTSEEVEQLGTDGSSRGYSRIDQPDTSLAHDLLEKIQLSLY